jgi:probable F420-dependent oxidoreductase
MRPFRFGVQSGGAAAIQDPRAWADHARMVEDLGFSTLQVADHLFPMLSPMPALAAAAQVTSTVRLGTLVVNQAWRHPTVLAKEAATVDFLSDGRLELGLGTGWVPIEQEKAGVPFEPAGTRVDRLIEYTRVVKGLLGVEPFSFEGGFYQIADLATDPKPVQRPLPILIGGSQKRVLQLAAREADIVALAMGAGAGPGEDPAAVLERKIGWIREAAGARFDALELSVLSFGALPVGIERREAARQLVENPVRTPGRQPSTPPTEASILASPVGIIGTAGQVVESLQQRRERFGISYVTYFPPGDRYVEFVQAFAPVVKALAGT